MKKLSTFAIATTLSTMSFASAHAADTYDSLVDFSNLDRWVFRARAIDVHPDVNSEVTGLAADITANNQVVPELDFTYFWTENIASELILASSRHEMGANNGTDLGDVLVVPPHLTMQYHFQPDSSAFRPYVGAGLGYLIYLNEHSGAVTSIDYQNSVSYDLQVGADFPIDDNWAFNLDVKKLYHNVDVSVNGGAIAADVNLDPWVVGAGLAYRF